LPGSRPDLEDDVPDVPTPLAGRRIRRPLMAAVAAVVIASALGGCGTSKDNDVASGLTIQDFAFNPDPINVEAGSKLTVVNLDGVVHTVTADDQSFDTGRIAGGKHTTISPKRPGRVAFHCSIHNFMRGVIRVTEQSRRS
jgi:plastocyanin